MISRNNLYAVILAGGSGTRFWPLSRAKNPKQFLNLVGRQSLLQQTLARVRPLVPPENILIVSSVSLAPLLKNQIRGLKIPSENISLRTQPRAFVEGLSLSKDHKQYTIGN